MGVGISEHFVWVQQFFHPYTFGVIHVTMHITGVLVAILLSSRKLSGMNKREFKIYHLSFNE
jgi:hypothetical protein